MLRYYLIATALVVGALSFGAAFYRPGKPLELAAVRATGSPSAARFQGASTKTPEPVTGDAPWALSAFPGCFAQIERVRGPRAYVLERLPASRRPVPSGATLRSGACTVGVLARGLRLARGEERLRVGRSQLFETDGVPFEIPAPRELVLLREGAGVWELRRYRTAGGARIELPGN